MKEENSPIKTYATIYMHYQFEMKKKSYYNFYQWLSQLSEIWNKLTRASGE